MKTLYTILLILITVAGESQTTDNMQKKTSVIINSGISFYSVINEDISFEKYSGTLIPFNFKLYSNITERQFRSFYFAIQTGTIYNFNVDAQINEVTLGWDYGFKLNKKKQYDLFLGPATFLYFSNRTQEMPSKYYINSKLGLVSLASVFGIKSNHLTKLNYNITSRLGLLTAGFSPYEDNQTKILNPLNGFQFFISGLVSYKIIKWADIAVEYSFQVYNITAWNRAYSLSDKLMINLIFSF